MTAVGYLCLIACIPLIKAWPLGFQDDADYNVFRQTGWNSNSDYNEDIITNNEPVYDPRETIFEQLPKTRFIPVSDPANNGGAKPFKFEIPTSKPAGKPRSIPLKQHIPTISDETPLYLNYADKKDPRDGLAANFLKMSDVKPVEEKPKDENKAKEEEKVTVAPVFEDKTTEDGEADDMDINGENKKDDPSMVIVWPEADEDELVSDEEAEARQQQPSFYVEQPDLDTEPEIDFTQRFRFPDLSGEPVETVVKDADVDDNNNSENNIENANNDSEEEPLKEKEPSKQEEPQEPQQEPQQATVAPVDPDLIKILESIAVPQHLAVASEHKIIPQNEVEFIPAEKRRAEVVDGSVTSSLTIPLVAGCVAAFSVACVGAAIFYRRMSRKKSYLDEEPTYGVTGPGPVKPNFLDLSGDRSLSKSAESYHFQQQKKNILQSLDNNLSSGSSEPKSGDHSDYDTEDDDDEQEDYGDYTVYECPGLAPPGEIEIVNPMFAPAKKDDSPHE